MAERTAAVTWNGSLLEGRGRIDSVGSEAFGPLDVTWASRAEDASAGRTSPEELIAAAHAACVSMALSHGLAQAGTPPDELKTTATVTFVPGTGITKIVLHVRGEVPGLDEAGFRAAAEAAKEDCPVSKALAGVPEILLDTRASIRT
jgi:osmotically inducible protein OsmC